MVMPLTQIVSAATGGPAALTGMGSTVGGSTGPSPSNESPFSDLMKDVVGDVNRLQQEAAQATTGLMTGSGVDVHQAMIATEKASMAFELSLALRNKAIQAYQQVMSMQF